MLLLILESFVEGGGPTVDSIDPSAKLLLMLVVEMGKC